MTGERREFIDVTDLVLTPMSLDDFDAYFAMKSDRADILMSGFATAPNRDSLLGWFKVEIRKLEMRLLVARLTQEPSTRVGYAFLRTKLPANDVEISYGVDARHRGQGIGRQLVTLAAEYIRDSFPRAQNAICWVADDNTASIKNVIAAGYVDTGDRRTTTFMAPAPHTKIMRRFARPIAR